MFEHNELVTASVAKCLSFFVSSFISFLGFKDMLIKCYRSYLTYKDINRECTDKSFSLKNKGSCFPLTPLTTLQRSVLRQKLSQFLQFVQRNILQVFEFASQHFSAFS